MHNPFAKWKTLREWEGREGRWTESTDDGPASENDGTCVIMGDRRLSIYKCRKRWFSVTESFMDCKIWFTHRHGNLEGPLPLPGRSKVHPEFVSRRN